MSSPQPHLPYVASATPPVPVQVVQGTQFGINASTNQGMHQMQMGLGPVQAYYNVGIQGGNFQTAHATGINYGIGSQQQGASTSFGQSGYGHSAVQSSSIFSLHDSKTQSEYINSSGIGMGATRNIGIGGTSILASDSGFKAGPQGMSMEMDVEIGGKKCIDIGCTNCACCCSCNDLCCCVNKLGSAAKAICGCLGEVLECVVKVINKPSP